MPSLFKQSSKYFRHKHCSLSSRILFRSLLVGLNNPGEDNLVLMKHIEGLLVPHKLVLMNQTLELDFVIKWWVRMSKL